MKKNIFLLICTVLAVLNITAQNFSWAKNMGGTSNDEGKSITTDAAGNVYTTGYFTGTADFDPGAGVFNLTSAGSQDIFVSKLDAAGNFMWAKKMGGTSIDIGYSITTDTSGNVYTTGYFQGTADFNPGAGVFNLTSAGGADIFVSKLDAAGNFMWAIKMGGTSEDVGLPITTDAAGNVYTTGYFQGTADFDPGAGVFNLTSAGGNDIFVSKLDAAGNFMWAIKMGSTSSDVGLSITTDAAGNVYTTGYFTGTADFDPGAGIFSLTSAGDDIFISKLDAAGNFMWAIKMGSTSSDYGYSITTDASSNVYTTGYFTGTADFDPGAGVFNLTSAGSQDIFVSKLDAAGNFMWAIKMGSTLADHGRSITTDAAGNVYTTGYFTGTADFNPGAGGFNLTSAGSADIFISKLDAAGNFMWAIKMGGASNDYGQFITTDAAGNVYTTGYFMGTVDFDPGAGGFNLASAGGTDIFVLKLGVSCTPTSSTINPVACNTYTSPSGNYTWTTSGAYTDTILNTGGCDSVMTINLTINNSATGTDTRTECNTLMWIDGNTYTTNNNVATFNIIGGAANGCDSLVSLDLTIIPSATGTDTRTECNTLTWIDGNTYTTSNNTVTFNIVNGAANGCDSLVSLDLTINTVDTSVTNTDPMLTANAVGANYKWLDCNNSYAIISGEIAQVFTATSNGNYAVEVTQNGCTDTSACYQVVTVGIADASAFANISLYPNPTTGLITINFDNNNIIGVRVVDVIGKEITYKNTSNQSQINLEIKGEKGLYFVEVIDVSNSKMIYKIVKN
ncbi:MAG: SBBP repeat-containing protein [Bacteroidetes bacterium]|nr:SBBP repeat-containing protein [Bacteroidota bacterium]